jgi:hypothetical protein
VLCEQGALFDGRAVTLFDGLGLRRAETRLNDHGTIIVAGPTIVARVEPQGIVRPSCVWQALFDIRNARQEHGVVLVAGVGAKNVFVPVVQGWAVLHDVGGCP